MEKFTTKYSVARTAFVLCLILCFVGPKANAEEYKESWYKEIPGNPEALKFMALVLKSKNLSVQTKFGRLANMGFAGSEGKVHIAEIVELSKQLPPAEHYLAVRALGKIGISAAPQMRELVQDPDYCHEALVGLIDYGPNAETHDAFLKLLTREIDGKSPRKSDKFSDALEDAMWNLKFLETPADKAVPLLVRFAAAPASQRRQHETLCVAAVEILGKYGAEAKSAVPSLIKILEECTTAADPHEDIFETAISALDQIGAPASSALPVLSRIANDKTGRLSTLRIKAEDAILEIEEKVLALEEKQ